jgi:hypothetical protein
MKGRVLKGIEEKDGGNEQKGMKRSRGESIGGNEREGTQRGRGMRNADDMENAIHMYKFKTKSNRSFEDRSKF